MPRKSLGQHWLKNQELLEAITHVAVLTPEDTVLEIGPGPGTLTSVLLSKVKKVVAVEFDARLAHNLPALFPGKNLEVIHADILTYDTRQLPKGYKVVANVPYYITQKIIEKFLGDSNAPEIMALLVQQEVAEKLAAQPGDMTAIAAKVQFTYNIHLGPRVPKEYFIPPPKVDSQVVICNKHHVDKYADIDKNMFYRVLQVGFSAPRKKLRSSLAGGLQLDKIAVEELLQQAGISPDLRAADVSVDAWAHLSAILSS